MVMEEAVEVGDLWQDLLSIFLVDPISAKEEIINCFKGIRVDGSNATIIGEQSGEFKADRNNIPRTWSDHGAWPVSFLISMLISLAILIRFLKKLLIGRINLKTVVKIDERWTDSYGYQRKIEMVTFIQLLYLSMFSYSN